MCACDLVYAFYFYVLLQAYVNSTGDVQTAALITSRCDASVLLQRGTDVTNTSTSLLQSLAPTTAAATGGITVEWLHTYRDLLNHWQVSLHMFILLWHTCIYIYSASVNI
jgi:hypothetical protein